MNGLDLIRSKQNLIIFSPFSINLISTVIPYHLFWEDLKKIPFALATFNFENVQWKLIIPEHQSSPFLQSHNFNIGDIKAN